MKLKHTDILLVEPNESVTEVTVTVRHAVQFRDVEVSGGRRRAQRAWVRARFDERPYDTLNGLICERIDQRFHETVFHFVCDCDLCQCYGVGRCSDDDPDFDMQEI